MKLSTTKLVAALVAVATVFSVGSALFGDVITNRGEVITVTTMGESTKVVDQMYLGGAVRLTDTSTTAPTTGFLTIRGTNLVFIATVTNGVAVPRDTAYTVLVSGILP